MQILMGLALALSVIIPHRTLAAGPEPVDLKSAAHFAILAGPSITSTSGGAIDGDVGVSPGNTFTPGTPPVTINGTLHLADSLSLQAKNDLITAYTNAEGRTSPTLVAGGALGSLTLPPGLYKDDGAPVSLGLTGTLTLDAAGDPNAVWIFQSASTLIAEANSSVVLTHGAQARNVFWQVGSSATLRTGVIFKGTIMALSAITLETLVTLEGLALARNEAVTLDNASISLPTPEAPRFTRISRTAADSATVVLSTTPYFLMTLEARPDLLLTNWTTIAAEIPVARLWTNTDSTATAIVTQRFYRAFISR